MSKKMYRMHYDTSQTQTGTSSEEYIYSIHLTALQSCVTGW